MSEVALYTASDLRSELIDDIDDISDQTVALINMIKDVVKQIKFMKLSKEDIEHLNSDAEIFGMKRLEREHNDLKRVVQTWWKSQEGLSDELDKLWFATARLMPKNYPQDITAYMTHRSQSGWHAK